jgi:WD40 repeat protein
MRRVAGVGTQSLKLLAILAAAFAVAPSVGGAQYFGRNKVQYETFDFRVMNTPHFDIHFYPAESLVTADAARMSERWYARLSGIMRHQFNKKPLIFYADHPDFQQTNVIGGFIDQSTGGVTESLRNRVIMPFTGIYSENDHVLGHEMVHVFQYDIADSPTGGGFQGLAQLPLWLVEGMAEYLSVGRNDPHTAMWMRDAALRNDLPSIKQLTSDPRFFPYRYGQALWAYIGGKWGDQAVSDVYRASLRAGWDAALRRVIGISSDSLSKEWLSSIRAAYLPLMDGRARPETVGQPLIGNLKEPGEMNVAPAVSPDGRYVALFARRGLFTVDLAIADANTGRIIRTLTGPNADPHFDALSFVSASGSWSPDGRKLAFIAFKEGDNQIVIFDVASGDEERAIGVRGVGGINDAAWSPDGNFIAVSGIAGGISDLFVIDVRNGEVRRLTNDRYAELHPAWSPDGQSIAFATDRGPATDFQRLRYGEMNLAVIDVGSANIRTLDIFAGAKHINPQFTPDGRQLYFVSDREGFSDIYRIDLASNDVYQVTRIATGVSGVTSNSPTLSVARQTGRIMFSVFNNGGNLIHALTPEQAQGTLVARGPQGAIAAAGVLTPVDAAATSIVQEYLADANTGLPPGTPTEISKYNPDLSLAYLGAPQVGVAISNQSYGGGIAGAVSAGFSDMLETRQVGAAIAAQGTLKDIGGEVYYQSLKRRWNWIAGASHIPYLTGFQQVSLIEDQGTPIYQVDNILQRVFIDNATFILQYPFSQTRRIAFTGSFNHYSYDNDTETFYYLTNGQFIGQERGDTPAPEGLSFGQASVALVGDYSYFGFASPVAGGRYRFEVSPAFGQINFTTVLGDYRRYFFAQPFTFAFRGLYYGRFGKDAEGDRLSPLYLGQETLVRGYDIVSNFDPADCTNTSESQCPEFDRLIGSKIGVASAEIRFPLFGVREYGLINFPYLPTEIAPFFDAGVAWAEGDPPEFTFDRNATGRVPVFSTGVSARMNVLGYLVFEAYYAYPFQRRGKGGHFGFVLSPGW